jgi:tRNA-specific 2-thiouridylase
MNDTLDKDTSARHGPADEHASNARRRITALALMSGGLDSRLAAALMLEQGVRVIALNFDSVFCHAPPPGTRSEAQKACAALGIELVRAPFSDQLIPLVKDPPHGHGKHMNPCVDCRIAQFRLARRYMDTRDAQFFVTGEVVGQRPMSQRLEAMRLIEREAGVEGYVLRPLSAKLMPPTVPEQKGWVDRDKLQAFSGRSRKPQMELAARLGVTDYPGSAGGCLLTDEGFACKVYELIERTPEANEWDFELLKLGRHYRLPSGAKAVVGRNEAENNRLEAMAQAGDVLLERDDMAGPTVLLCGARDKHGADDRNLAARLCVLHSKRNQAAAGTVRCRTKAALHAAPTKPPASSCNPPTAAMGGEHAGELVHVEALDKAALDAMRIVGKETTVHGGSTE